MKNCTFTYEIILKIHNTGLPTDRPVLEALLLDDLEKTTHQLKQLSTIVSSQNEELREKIDRYLDV